MLIDTFIFIKVLLNSKLRLCLIILLAVIFCRELGSQSKVTSDLIESYLSSEDPAVQYKLFDNLMYASHEKSFDSLLWEAEELSELSKIKDDKRYLSFGYSLIGDVHFLSGVYDSAAYYYLLQAECLLQEPNTSSVNTLRAAGFGNTAASLNMAGQKQDALIYGRQALHYARLVGEIKGEADAHFTLASAFYGLLHLDSALIHLNTCYEIDLALQDTRGLISIQYMIGNLYTDQNNYDLAFDMYYKAISEIPDSNSYERLTIAGYNYLSEIHAKTGNIDSAMYYINLALSNPKAKEIQSIRTKLTLKKAELLMSEQRVDEALTLFHEIEANAFKNDKSSVKFFYLKLCLQINISNELLSDAENCLEEALRDINENNLETRRLSIFPLAIKLYEKKGDHIQALFYSKQLTRLTEQLNTDELEKEVLKTRYNYENKTLQNEKEIIQLEKDLVDEQLSKRKLLSIFLTGFLLLSFLILYLYYRHSKAKENLRIQVQEAVLEKKEKQIIEKEMQALRSQMNPHFMFNSLSSINHYIMNEEPRNASRFLTKFASLMRMILSNSKKRYISLHEEVKALKLYMEIENLRFNNKFNFNLSIDETLNTESILIPPLILQPYIENAIKHAFVDVAHQPEINISIQKVMNGADIIIEDNGIGRRASSTKKKVLANGDRPHSMAITKSRLELISKLYDLDSSLVITDKTDLNGKASGTHIKIHIPTIQESTTHHEKTNI